MKRLIATTLVATILLTARGTTRAVQPAPDPATRVAEAMEAMGGESRLTSVHSLTLDSIGHAWALEQSERPEGPWLSTYTQKVEVRDYEHHRGWIQVQRRDWTFPQWTTPNTVVVNGDVSARNVGTQWRPGIPLDIQSVDDAVALSPERLLFTARSAADLRGLPDELQQGVRQQVLGFSWSNKRVRLLLNPWTHLPTMLEVVANDQYGIWGDVTERRWYGFWTLEKGGLRYPRQTTVERNGQLLSDETVQTLTVDGVLDESRFAIPPEVEAAYRAAAPSAAARPSGLASLSLDAGRAVALAPDIVQLPGSFNVALVRQPDGVVVIEATTSAQYSQQVLAATAARFPGVPIKALVTTSDAWFHIGGIREYVARGIPIYALDLNVSILKRIIESPHTLSPDALAQRPTSPLVRSVTTRTSIGTGDARIELLPVRGEIGERMMFVWLPGARLLYTSDLIQRDRTGKGFFMPEMLAEAVSTVEREHVTGIDRVFGMHLAATPWTAVTGALAAVRATEPHK